MGRGYRIEQKYQSLTKSQKVDLSTFIVDFFQVQKDEQVSVL